LVEQDRVRMQYYNHLFFNIALGIAYEVRAYALLFQVGIREIKNSISIINTKLIKMLN
jgi:hypothetical protein